MMRSLTVNGDQRQRRSLGQRLLIVSRVNRVDWEGAMVEIFLVQRTAL
jgi:hypothetical protein